MVGKERSVWRGWKAKVRVEMTTQFDDTMQEFGVNLTITGSSQYSSSEIASIIYSHRLCKVAVYCGGTFSGQSKLD